MLIHPQKKAMVLRLKDPGKVTTLIPVAKPFDYKGERFVAVPHNIDAVKVLRNIGMKAPAPIRYYYKWPGRYKPFAAQESTAAFLSMHNRAFCLSQIGTGKSLATLWAYDYLRSIGRVQKLLVVSPLSTLERTWGDEIFINFPHLNYTVLHGDRARRLKLLKQDSDVYIINHDGVQIILDEMNSRPDINLVVIDEISQVARNASTNRWKALNRLINGKVVRAAWGLTGTPTPNSPMDAFAQCKLLVPETVPKYANRFRDLVMRQVSTYNWVPRDDALDRVRDAMQPSIRFTRDECVDLPPCMYETREVEMSPEQKAAYKAMMKNLHVELESGQITAVNEAVKVSKLVQIACLSGETEVLTETGWVPIRNVHKDALVWDGVEWVGQRGVASKGYRNVIDYAGVRMTDDHLVMSTTGWATAREMSNGRTAKGDRLDRADVRLPYSPPKSRTKQKWLRNMGVRMRMWCDSNANQSISQEEAESCPAPLRMQAWQQDSRYVRVTPVQHMDPHAAAMSRPGLPRLSEVWRAWDHSVRAMGQFFFGVLGRYAGVIPRWTVTGSERQRRPIFSRQLSMGYPSRTGWKQATKTASDNPETCGRDGDSCINPVPQEANGTSEIAVYDLLNCGPRNRFVVRGDSGQLLIVHNCGVAYNNEGEEVAIPSPSRLNAVLEILEGTDHKVIVFVPFVSAVNKVASYLTSKQVAVECVHGGVSKKERDRIFKAFQGKGGPKVLLAQPAAMSHGLTLTEANTIVWFAPHFSNEVFTQANGRITRPGQKNNQFIIMLEGCPTERKLYDRLRTKQKTEGLLLDLIKQEEVAT